MNYFVKQPVTLHRINDVTQIIGLEDCIADPSALPEHLPALLRSRFVKQ